MNLVPQIGFFELVVIAIIALVVVGPRDLPKLMRTAGQFAAKARRMASDFVGAFQQMARESEMEEMRREIEALKRARPLADASAAVEDTFAPLGDALQETEAELKEARRAGEGL
jgi:sec-independent protein translocase protein TatB